MANKGPETLWMSYWCEPVYQPKRRPACEGEKGEMFNRQEHDISTMAQTLDINPKANETNFNNPSKPIQDISHRTCGIP
jgi:hypothetical protein